MTTAGYYILANLIPIGAVLAFVWLWARHMDRVEAEQIRRRKATPPSWPTSDERYGRGTRGAR